MYIQISVTHSLSSGLAGGAFFSTSFVHGTNSVMVLTQGTPSNIITVYEVENSAFLSENDAVHLNLFPNPTSELITVIVDGGFVVCAAVELLDMNGCVLRVMYIEEGVNEFELDVRNLQKGTYFIRLQTEGNSQS